MKLSNSVYSPIRKQLGQLEKLDIPIASKNYYGELVHILHMPLYVELMDKLNLRLELSLRGLS